jgi:hypothetical protein
MIITKCNTFIVFVNSNFKWENDKMSAILKWFTIVIKNGIMFLGRQYPFFIKKFKMTWQGYLIPIYI